MNLNEAHELLLCLDTQYMWGDEFPENFEYDVEVKRVRNLSQVIEHKLGIPLKVLTSSAQDSYFFAEIVYPPENPFGSELVLDIRFSSFGRLVSGWACPNLPSVVTDPISVVSQVVEAEGYRFVDFEWLLHTKYDGVHQLSDKSHACWWNRFFDYS